MTVKIGRGVRTALRRGQAFLQVRDADHEVAWDVLCGIHAELMGDPEAEDDTTIVWRGEVVDWIDWEGDVVDLPGGPGWFVDVSTWPTDERPSVAEVLAERLEAAGATEAIVAVPVSAHSVDRLFESCSGSAVVGFAHLMLKAHPVPDGWHPLLPEQWVRRGLAWTAGVERLSLFGTGLPDIWIPPVDAVDLAMRVHPRSSQLYLASDADANFVHSAVLTGVPGMPTLVDLAGGALDADQLAEQARRITETFLGFDPLPVYAGIRFLPNTFHGDIPWAMESDTGKPLDNFYFVNDRAVPDGYWWQLLGTGHRDRLGGWPDGAEVLDSGNHAVLTIGQPQEWADPTTAEGVQAQARQALEPLIVHDNSDVARVRWPNGTG